jgi:1,4-alpha-glucan branching enzyme
MNAFDQATNELDERFSFLSSPKQIVSDTNEEEKVMTT